MKRIHFQIKNSILINKSIEEVWDYTQNYANRSKWDLSIINYSTIQLSPHRMVQLYLRDGTEMKLIYKSDERPFKTSLIATDIKSWYLFKAGGHWSYKLVTGQTLWTQTNAIQLKPKFILKILSPIFKISFYFIVKHAMQKAKRNLEQ